MPVTVCATYAHPAQAEEAVGAGKAATDTDDAWSMSGEVFRTEAELLHDAGPVAARTHQPTLRALGVAAQ